MEKCTFITGIVAMALKELVGLGVAVELTGGRTHRLYGLSDLAPVRLACQSASESDPRSACKVDPLRGWWMRGIWV
jgi:hypothetical protein